MNESGKTDSVRGYISGDKVYVRADHPVYTADQIMRHEAGHAKIASGEIDPDTVRERIGRKYGGKHMTALSGLYTAAYEGSGMTCDEIWEEVICDALGDMNIFRTYEVGDVVDILLNEVGESAETEAYSARGPPDVDGADRMSMEVEDLLPIIRKAPGIKWNGGRPLELSKSEYAAVTSRISTRYYYSNTGHSGVQFVDRSTDGKNAKHYVYLYTDHGFGVYQIIGRLTYNRNDELIRYLREEIIHDRATESVSEEIDPSRNINERFDSGGNAHYHRAANQGNDQTDIGSGEEWSEGGRRSGRTAVGGYDEGRSTGGVASELLMKTPVRQSQAQNAMNEVAEAADLKTLAQIKSLKVQYQKLAEEAELDRAFLRGFGEE